MEEDNELEVEEDVAASLFTQNVLKVLDTRRSKHRRPTGGKFTGAIPAKAKATRRKKNKVAKQARKVNR